MGSVHEIRITIPAASFKAMQLDLATIGPAGGMMGGRGAGNAFIGGAVGRGARPGGAGVPDQNGNNVEAMMQGAVNACTAKAAVAM